MKPFLTLLFLFYGLPASAGLIAYDYEGVIGQPPPGEIIDVTGSVVFDTSLLGIKRLTIKTPEQKLTWISSSIHPLELTESHEPIQYVVSKGSFDIYPDGYELIPLWEVWLPEPASLFEILTNFDSYWSEETSPHLWGPDIEAGNLIFHRVGSAYSVPEPITLTLLALGLAVFGMRQRV